ncbi:hypothetical protein SSX86_015587 [Deinandra increscens subsp. villosa]|uniref:Glabrous enhancer-binding protein-like DBD domain-containing protein n=1 Tax=Deinandra increscens subsp. villosa TaxID=3103831 RepID=A0AAP0D157_9ASTR
MAGSEHEPANSSSAEEEEDELSSDESESPPPPSSHKTPPSDDESASDSDDTPDKPQLPDPSTKPPMDQSKKPRSKHLLVTAKRPAAETAEAAAAAAGDVKRIKKAATVVAAVAAPDAEENCGGEKKQLFQRLWSEENEIELIEGMINYVEEKGKDPLTDVNGFYEFVKRSLHVDVNDRQVLTKARRLKKKFQDNAARVESKGKVRSFSKPHEKKMYDLSKSLWGDDNNGNKSAVMSACSKNVKVKVNVTPKTNNSHNKSSVGLGNGNVANPKMVQAGFGLMGLPITDEVIINKGLELVLGPKKVEMEEKWRNLKVLELEHFLKKVEVLKEQAEVVLNAMAKSGAK